MSQADLIFLFAGGVAVLIGVYIVVKQARRYRRFILVFGFGPYSDTPSFSMTPLETIVISVLRHRAKEFIACCGREAGANELVQLDPENDGAIKTLWQTEKDLQIWKDAFWEAHGLAKWGGYPVKGKAGEYA